MTDLTRITKDVAESQASQSNAPLPRGQVLADLQWLLNRNGNASTLIKEWAKEVARRNKQIALSQRDLAECKLELKRVKGRLSSVNTKIADAHQALNSANSLSPTDDLVDRVADVCLRAKSQPLHSKTIAALTAQLTATMTALTKAGIKEVGGDVTTRIARRVELLAHERAAAAAIIREAHERLNMLGAPSGKTLMHRLKRHEHGRNDSSRDERGQQHHGTCFPIAGNRDIFKSSPRHA